MFELTANLYSFMPPPINQSERGYSVRHGAYVRCFNQSEHGYSVRHGLHVRCLTNQSTVIAYVTGVRTLFDQSGHDILMRVRPLNKYAQPRTASKSMHSLKKGGRKTPTILHTAMKRTLKILQNIVVFTSARISYSVVV